MWIHLYLQIDTGMEINNNTTRNMMDPDPFKVRIKFTKSDYVKMAVMGVTVLPIRILGKIMMM